MYRINDPLKKLQKLFHKFSDNYYNLIETLIRNFSFQL